MDHNLFRIDCERVFEALVGVIALSCLVERFYALIIESRWYAGANLRPGGTLLAPAKNGMESGEMVGIAKWMLLPFTCNGVSYGISFDRILEYRTTPPTAAGDSGAPVISSYRPRQ